jgi:hypothetical protein
MKRLLQKVVLIIADGNTKEMGIFIFLYMKEVVRLSRRSGLLFTALYLKQCASS